MELQRTNPRGEYKRIILFTHITQNPTDHFELIPPIEQLKNNLSGIYEEMPSNFQFGADNEYSTDENTTYLEEKCLEGFISSKKLSKKKKKAQFIGKPFQKDNFCYDTEIETYICPLVKFYAEENHTNTKTNKE